MTLAGPRTHAEASRQIKVLLKQILCAAFKISFHFQGVEAHLFGCRFQMFPFRDIFLFQKNHFAYPAQELDGLVFVLHLSRFERDGRRIRGRQWILQPNIAINGHLVMQAHLIPVMRHIGGFADASAVVHLPGRQEPAHSIFNVKLGSVFQFQPTKLRLNAPTSGADRVGEIDDVYGFGARCHQMTGFTFRISRDFAKPRFNVAKEWIGRF